MKKFLVLALVVMTAACLQAVTVYERGTVAGVNDDFAGWVVESGVTAYNMDVGTTDGILDYSISTNNTNNRLHADTGIVIEEDNYYSANFFVMNSWQLDSVILRMYEVSTGADIVGDQYYPMPDSSLKTDKSNWPLISISFNAADSNYSEFVGSNLGLEIGLGNAPGAWLWWDFVTVEVWDSVAFDPMPVDADPAAGTNGNGLDVNLSWNTGRSNGAVNSDITYHFLYIDTDPDFSDNDPVAIIPAGDPVQQTASYLLEDAGYNQTYYWRVDEGVNLAIDDDPNFAVTGDVWSFTTKAQIPTFLSGPDNAAVFAGETAMFTANVASPTPLQYQWYVSSDDVLVPSGDTAVGMDSPNLEVPNVQLTDAGNYYYVVATNDGGSVTSDAAMLEVKRLMGHWDFNGNLMDSSGNGWYGIYSDPNDVDPSSNPTFGTGVDGQALDLTVNADRPEGTTGAHVRIPGSEAAFNTYHIAGMTVSAWVKTDFEGWATIAAKNYTPDYDGWLFGMQNTGLPYYTLRSGTQAYPSTATYLNDNQWHFVTAVYDAQQGTATLYVDGEPEYTSAVSYGMTFANEPVVIGAGQVSGTAPFEGLIDNVRIYNYPVDVTDIAQLYYDITQENSCVLSYASEFDVSGPDGSPDCQVDIYDFAQFAQGWLTCGLYPYCE